MTNLPLYPGSPDSRGNSQAGKTEYTKSRNKHNMKKADSARK